MQKLADALAAAKAVVPSTQYLVQEYSHGAPAPKVATGEDSFHIPTVGSRDRQDSGEKASALGASPSAAGGTPDKSDPSSLSHSTVRGRSASRAMSMSMILTPSKYDMNKYQDDYQATAKACKLALRVVFCLFVGVV